MVLVFIHLAYFTKHEILLVSSHHLNVYHFFTQANITLYVHYVMSVGGD